MPQAFEPQRSKDAVVNWDPNFLDSEIEEEGSLWEVLSAYADGEVSPHERGELEALIRADIALAQDLAFLQDAHRLLFTEEEIAPPTNLRTNILAATTNRPTLRRRLVALWNRLQPASATGAMRYAMPMGAIAATALVTFAALNHNEDAKTFSTPVEVAQVAPYSNSDSSTSPALPPIVTPLSLPKNIVQKPSPETKTQAPRNALSTSPRVEVASFNADRNPVSAGHWKPVAPTTKMRVTAQKASKPAMLVAFRKPPTPMPPEFTPQPMMETEYQKPMVKMMTAAAEFPDVRPREGEGDGTIGTMQSAVVSNVQGELSDEERQKARIKRLRNVIYANAQKQTSNLLSDAEVSARNKMYNGQRSQNSSLVLGRF